MKDPIGSLLREPPTFYIYQLRVQGQKLPFYIGKGTGKRFTNHWHGGALKGKSHKINTINKALREGFDIFSEILQDGLSEAEAFKLEREWISYYGRRDLGTGCLTNLTDGGEGQSGRVMSDATRQALKTRVFSEETRVRMSESARLRARSPEGRRQLSAINLGRIHSDKTRRILSAAQTGRTHSDSTKLKMARSAKKRHATKEPVFRSRLAWINPLFELVEYNVGGRSSNFRCRFCGTVFTKGSGRMLSGQVPKDHYWCSVEAFNLDGDSRVYKKNHGPYEQRLSMLVVEPPLCGRPFQFSFRKKGVVFTDLEGNELSRVRLPEEYMRARIAAEHKFAGRTGVAK